MYGLGIETLAQRQARVEAATPQQRDLAATLYRSGQAAYRARDYLTAIRFYTDAWNLIPARNILLAIGLTMLRMGRFQDSIYRFQRYLREYPDGPEKDLATTSLAEAQSALEQQAQRTAAPPPPRPPEVSPAQVAAVTQSPEQISSTARSPETLPDPYAQRTSIGVWVATGAGVLVLVGLGVYLVRRKPPTPNRRRRRRTSRRR